mgnify:CR=1 FL=1
MLAHPGLLPESVSLNELFHSGIVGIEAFHSKHTRKQSQGFLCLAKENDLIATGGSDFHGELFNTLPYIDIEDVTVGMDVVETLKRQAIQNK